MAQGREYTAEERQRIFESLRPYLELGFSRVKSCKLIGFDHTTLSKWVNDDESLSMMITGWENTISALAMANIADAIRAEGKDQNDIKKENSWKWAERKEETMKPKQDVTTNDKDLPTPLLNALFNNDSNKEGSQTI